MILSFRDNWLGSFFQSNRSSRKIPADIEVRLFRKLQLIDDATCNADLRVPPSNRFEKLSGNLKMWHSIRINRQWRLIFLWNGGAGEADDIYLDKHEYR